MAICRKLPIDGGVAPREGLERPQWPYPFSTLARTRPWSERATREIGSGGCVQRISGDPTGLLDFRGSHFAILHPCKG